MEKKIFKKCYLALILAMTALCVWGAILILDDFKQVEKYDTLEELRPCPFCGTTDLEYERYYVGGYENGTPDMTEVRCENCHARVTIWYEGDSNIPDAKEIWNRRK